MSTGCSVLVMRRVTRSLSSKKPGVTGAWCPLELAPGEEARTIHYRAMAGITHHQPGLSPWSPRGTPAVIISLVTCNTSSLPPDFVRGIKIL